MLNRADACTRQEYRVDACTKAILVVMGGRKKGRPRCKDAMDIRAMVLKEDAEHSKKRGSNSNNHQLKEKEDENDIKNY